MMAADLGRLAELDRIYERVMEAAVDQMMPGCTRVETAFRNGRGRRRNQRTNGGRTVRMDVRAEAERTMLALAESSEDPHARKFAALVEERDDLIALRTALAESVFDGPTTKRMEKVIQMAKNGAARPEMVGTAEIAELLGVSRQRVHQLAVQPDFPEPVQNLSAGSVWALADVEAWRVRAGR